ncbi:MAG: hypothetical protein HY231_07790 [Acidobacteria bacterium]|nr:hypothetical protein [Acidobacteriota bacterium]
MKLTNGAATLCYNGKDFSRQRNHRVEIISPESRARDRGENYYEDEEGGVPE